MMRSSFMNIKLSEVANFNSKNSFRKIWKRPFKVCGLFTSYFECFLQKLWNGGAFLRFDVLPVAGTVPIAEGHGDLLVFLLLLHFLPFLGDSLALTKIKLAILIKFISRITAGFARLALDQAGRKCPRWDPCQDASSQLELGVHLRLHRQNLWRTKLSSKKNIGNKKNYSFALTWTALSNFGFWLFASLRDTLLN